MRAQAAPVGTSAAAAMPLQRASATGNERAGGIPGEPEASDRTSGSTLPTVELVSEPSGPSVSRAIEPAIAGQTKIRPRTTRAPPEQRLQPAFPGNERNRLKPRLRKIIRTSLAPRVPALRLSRRSGQLPSCARRPHRVGRRPPSRCPCSEPPQIIRTSRAEPRTKRAAPEQRLQPVFPGNKRNRLKPRLRKIIRTSLAPRISALRLGRRSSQLPSCARRPHRVGRRPPSRCPCSEPPQMIRTSRSGPRMTRAAPEQRLQPVFPGNERNRLKPRLRTMLRT